MYSVTFQKILLYVGIGVFVGLMIGLLIGDVQLGVYSTFLSIITILLTAIFAELYHVREAINKQRAEQKDPIIK
ncbi:hypothetical protein [Thalassobacillus sp. B23F22_16]|uniref:hypothetical protein n=1 Tax=Thalassobacillus sp. B23F22_16 TaxID=3459513 RepID=UPI00373F3831